MLHTSHLRRVLSSANSRRTEHVVHDLFSTRCRNLQAGCEFVVVCDTRVVMVRVRVDAIEQTDFRVRAACIAGSSHAVWSSQTAPLAVFLLAAAIENFLPVVVWDRS